MTFVGGGLWWILFGALLGWVAAWWLGRSSQRLLAEPVVEIVERRMDNPRHVARITALEREAAELGARAATVEGLQTRIAELEATPPTVVEKIVEKVVTRTVERVVEKPVERIVDRPVPDTAAIAEREAALRTQALRIEHLQALAAVLADRCASHATREAPQAASGSSVPSPTGHASSAPPVAAAPSAADPMRPLRARLEHLEALAAVQAARLARAADTDTTASGHA